MTRFDLEYCERRAREENEAADRATAVEAATAHRLLAQEFVGKAMELRSKSAHAESGREILKLRPGAHQA